MPGKNAVFLNAPSKYYGKPNGINQNQSNYWHVWIIRTMFSIPKTDHLK